MLVEDRAPGRSLSRPNPPPSDVALIDSGEGHTIGNRCVLHYDVIGVSDLSALPK